MRGLPPRFALAALLLALATCTSAADSVLRGEHLGIVVNEADRASLEAGEYLRSVRGVPEANVIRVRIPGSPPALTPEAFAPIRQQIEAALPAGVEVIALAWTTPYAVGCNSITAAVTLGFDPEQCTNTCARGKPNPYYDSAAARPRAELGLRPSMLLPAADGALATAIVDRGHLSGFRMVAAGAYFVATSDTHRNTRAIFFPRPQQVPSRRLTIHRSNAALEGRNDVMIYQIGAVTVPHLDTLTFLPGALADHLTSTGGVLTGSSQMSSLRWLEAGATASYGTVSEPCNHWQKFPNPAVLLKHYLNGATAIEAYWKSVAWPAQGVFIGEPLAAPYCAACRKAAPKTAIP